MFVHGERQSLRTVGEQVYTEVSIIYLYFQDVMYNAKTVGCSIFV